MGSRSTQETKVPEYIEEAGKLALERAKQIQAMGYIPYMGPEVAAVNPYEQAAAANVGGMASAFGMQAPAGLSMGGMPTVTQGGMTGYTSYPAYMSSLERLREVRPDMYQYLSNMTKFDPITGQVNPEYDAFMERVTAPPAPAVSSGGGNDDDPFFGTAPIAGSRDPRASSPRPVLRGQDTGGSSGLFGGLRDARDEIKNRALDVLGVV
jgi:hypothetical protein